MIFKALQKPFSRDSKTTSQLLSSSGLELYQKIIEQSRIPFLYKECQVSDTPEGRFDMIALHLFIVIYRIDSIPQTEPLIQKLIEIFIEDIDSNLREMGTSDQRIGSKVRVFAEALYGRLDAYRTTFEKNPERMSETIARNVYRKRQIPARAISSLIGYFFIQTEFLKKQDDNIIVSGEIIFAPPVETHTL